MRLMNSRISTNMKTPCRALLCWAWSCLPTFVFLAGSAFFLLDAFRPEQDYAFLDRMVDASIAGWLIPVAFCIGFTNDRKRLKLRQEMRTKLNRPTRNALSALFFALTMIPTAALLPAFFIFVELSPAVMDGKAGRTISLFVVAACLFLFAVDWRNDRDRVASIFPGSAECKKAMRAAWAIHGAWIAVLVGYVVLSGFWFRTVVSDRLPGTIVETVRAFQRAKTGGDRLAAAFRIADYDSAWRKQNPKTVLSPTAWMSRLGPPDITNRNESESSYAYRIHGDYVLSLLPLSKNDGCCVSVERMKDANGNILP